MEPADPPDAPRRYPRDLPLRVARVLLACWLIIGPFLLGFGGTFAQRQDTVAGILLLVSGIIGLFVPGMRVSLLLVGGWLILSPRLSYEYYFQPVAYWHDSIIGLLCLFLGLLPIWSGDLGVVRKDAAQEEEARARRWRIWRARRPVAP